MVNIKKRKPHPAIHVLYIQAILIRHPSGSLSCPGPAGGHAPKNGSPDLQKRYGLNGTSPFSLKGVKAKNGGIIHTHSTQTHALFKTFAIEQHGRTLR